MGDENFGQSLTEYIRFKQNLPVCPKILSRKLSQEVLEFLGLDLSKLPTSILFEKIGQGQCSQNLLAELSKLKGINYESILTAPVNQCLHCRHDLVTDYKEPTEVLGNITLSNGHMVYRDFQHFDILFQYIHCRLH